MHNETNYYERNEVSNSDLTSLMRLYYDVDFDSSELTGTFNFGNLVDAMLTEEKKVLRQYNAMVNDYGELIEFDTHTFDYALLLTQALKDDALIKKILPFLKGQYVFVRKDFRFEFEGDEYSIEARCKFDGFSKSIQTGMEYKTTACTTKGQFEESIYHFHYDRACAWYMDLAKISRYWVAGVSKVNGKVFKIAIDPSHEIYKSGKKKYCFWGSKWIQLIDNLNLKTNGI